MSFYFFRFLGWIINCVCVALRLRHFYVSLFVLCRVFINKKGDGRIGCFLTCHRELSEGHPLQERAEQLTGSIFQAEEQTNSFAVVKLCQAPVLLPQVLVSHLSHN